MIWFIQDSDWQMKIQIAEPDWLIRGTCEHALVDDTVSADEDGITAHNTAILWDENHIAGYQPFGISLLAYCVHIRKFQKNLIRIGTRFQ